VEGLGRSTGAFSCLDDSSLSGSSSLRVDCGKGVRNGVISLSGCISDGDGDENSRGQDHDHFPGTPEVDRVMGIVEQSKEIAFTWIPRI